MCIKGEMYYLVKEVNDSLYGMEVKHDRLKMEMPGGKIKPANKGKIINRKIN